MTLSARRNRHVRFEPAQCRGLRDVDVACRALRNVIFLLTPAIVYELRRDPRWLGGYVRCARELVTAVAVRGNWLLRLPVTVET